MKCDIFAFPHFAKKGADIPARKVGERDEAGGTDTMRTREAPAKPEVAIVKLTSHHYTAFPAAGKDCGANYLK